jgi:hypothetical protein
MAAERGMQFSDPDNVKEVLVTGPCSAVRSDGDSLIVLTCTAVRHDPQSLFTGKSVRNCVVVSRLVFKASAAKEIAKAISDHADKD